MAPWTNDTMFLHFLKDIKPFRLDWLDTILYRAQLEAIGYLNQNFLGSELFFKPLDFEMLFEKDSSLASWHIMCKVNQMLFEKDSSLASWHIMCKVNKASTRTRREICSMLTIKTPERLIDVALVSLLTLIKFQALAWCLQSWLWTSIC